MTGLIVILGIGITSFLLLYLAFYCLDKEHVLLRLLITFFVIYLLFMMSRATQGNTTECGDIINQTTTNTQYHYLNASQINYTTTNTTYTYGEYCIYDSTTSASLFYRLMTWFLRVFAVYLLVYYIYKVLKYASEQADIKKRRGGMR